MSRFFTLTLVAVLLCLGRATQGQGHDAHWIFGNGFHLEFNDDGPTILPRIEDYFSREGGSCISDPEGNLLYYSNVVNIWNRNFEPLSNSDTLGIGDPPYSTKSSGSLFLPWPGDTADRYVGFLAMNDLNHKLYLSKIDRFLDSGLGGIIDTFRYIEVWEEPIGEQLNAVRHGNGRDWWIVARKRTLPASNEFIIALLTPDGVSYWQSQGSGYFGNEHGTLTFSRNGDRMAAATSKGLCPTSPSSVALYSFNRCDGQFNLIDTLPTRECSPNAYGVAFSPDGNRIYYSTSERTNLYQASLIDGKLVDTLVFSPGGGIALSGGNLLGGSNGKIYVNYMRFLPSVYDTFGMFLGVINSPNFFGPSCQFDTFGLYLGGEFNTGASLPNFANYDLGPLVGSPCDTLSPQDTTQTGIFHQPTPREDWSVFPTTSSGLYTLQSDQAGWLMVHDLYGREVLTQWHEQTTPFDLTAQPAGLYLVHLRAADGKQSLPQKIIRQ